MPHAACVLSIPNIHMVHGYDKREMKKREEIKSKKKKINDERLRRANRERLVNERHFVNTSIRIIRNSVKTSFRISPWLMSREISQFSATMNVCIIAFSDRKMNGVCYSRWQNHSSVCELATDWKTMFHYHFAIFHYSALLE